MFISASKRRSFRGATVTLVLPELTAIPLALLLVVIIVIILGMIMGRIPRGLTTLMGAQIDACAHK